MVGGHDEAGADGLLAKVIPKNPGLDALHDVTSEEPHHRQVHPCVHEPKRVSSRNYTVEGWQVLEPTADDLDFRMGPKLPTQHIAELLTPVHKD